MVYKTIDLLFQGRRGLRVGTDIQVFTPFGTDRKQIFEI